MKILIFFVIIFQLNFYYTESYLNSTFLYNVDQKLPKSICKITNGITNSKTGTHDILIANLGNKIWSSTVNEIIKCMDDENVIVVADLRFEIREKNLRKATVIIMTIDFYRNNLLIKIVNDHLHSSVWHHMSKIFCLVPKSLSPKQRSDILDTFANLGFLDVAVVYMTTGDDFTYEIFRLTKNLNSYNTVFPDKLKNLGGYEYRIPLYHQPPNVVLYPKYIKPVMIYFFEAISTVQNSGIEVIHLPNYSHLRGIWERREMDFSLNTGTIFDTKEPKLFTYEKDGYCALVPIPPKIPLYYLIFVKPFDALIWLLFGVSVFSSVVIWRMFRGRGAVDSHWNLAVGIFTMFIGQGAEFSRHNRFVLAFLLNIICLTVFLLSNLYEGAITSSMIEPTHENRLKTVDDLLNSDLEIISDEGFAFLVKDDERYEKIVSRVNASGVTMGNQELEVTRQHFVFIRPCDLSELDLTLTLKNGKLVSDYYYMLPEKLNWQFVQLEASFLNPFLERIKYFLDLSFQAGLQQMWKVFAKGGNLKAKSNQNISENEFLELKDLISVLGILLLGLSASLLVFLVEIFYHDCIKHVKFSEIITFIGNQLRKFCKMQRQPMPKIRRIIVKPRSRNM